MAKNKFYIKVNLQSWIKAGFCGVKEKLILILAPLAWAIKNPLSLLSSTISL